LANKFLVEVAQVTAEGEIQYVKTGLGDSLREIEDAEGNLATAKSALNSGDLSGSFSMAYLAARKSVQAVLTAHGMRVKSGGKTHIVYVNVTKASIFRSSAWVRFDWMRTQRHIADYPRVDTAKVSALDCAEAISAAESMVQDVRAILSKLN
jgi:uncharacterized protein (UPF0332 family)